MGKIFLVYADIEIHITSIYVSCNNNLRICQILVRRISLTAINISAVSCHTQL